MPCGAAKKAAHRRSYAETARAHYAEPAARLPVDLGLSPRGSARSPRGGGMPFLHDSGSDGGEETRVGSSLSNPYFLCQLGLAFLLGLGLGLGFRLISFPAHR
jgi:hypothetical protein